MFKNVARMAAAASAERGMPVPAGVSLCTVVTRANAATVIQLMFFLSALDNCCVISVPTVSALPGPCQPRVRARSHVSLGTAEFSPNGMCCRCSAPLRLHASLTEELDAATLQSLTGELLHLSELRLGTTLRHSTITTLPHPTYFARAGKNRCLVFCGVDC